jgi:hypothetical protein
MDLRPKIELAANWPPFAAGKVGGWGVFSPRMEQHRPLTELHLGGLEYYPSNI